MDSGQAGLFDDGDPFDDPLWQAAELMAGAPPRPAKGYVICPLAWLTLVRPLVRSADQLLVLLLLYRRCLVARSRTVTLPNGELAMLGISRWTKYRAFAELVEAGALTVEARNGRSVQVTLHWFP
jgi:hypothetical protein